MFVDDVESPLGHIWLGHYLYICVYFSIILESDTYSYKPTTNIAEGHQGASGGTHLKAYADTNNEMMHTSMNTNLDILIRNCKKRNLAKSRHK